MINEIGTLLLNRASYTGEPFYIDPKFKPVNIPSSIRWVYNMVLGSSANSEETDPDIKAATVLYLIQLLNHVDTQKYHEVFDSRTLYPKSDDSQIYDLLKNLNKENTLTTIANNTQVITTLFYGDEYLTSLHDLYYKSSEGVVRVCAVILALAYQLKRLM